MVRNGGGCRSGGCADRKPFCSAFEPSPKGPAVSDGDGGVALLQEAGGARFFVRQISFQCVALKSTRSAILQIIVERLEVDLRDRNEGRRRVFRRGHGR